MKAGMIISASLAAVAAAGIAVFFAMRNTTVDSPAAEVRVNGELIRTLPLDVDTQFTVENEYGCNTIAVSGGAVSVTAADCPDRVCVHTGAISGGVVPIICLPHRLEIRVVSAGKTEIDAGVY